MTEKEKNLLGLTLYHEFVDSLCAPNRATSPFAVVVDKYAENVFPDSQYCTKKAISDTWLTLSAVQKAGMQSLLKYVCFEEHYKAMAKALRVFSRFTISQNGVPFAHMPYGFSLEEDWARRCKGNSWSNEAEEELPENVRALVKYGAGKKEYSPEGLEIYQQLVDSLIVPENSEPPSITAIDDYVSHIDELIVQQAFMTGWETMTESQKFPMAAFFQCIIGQNQYNGIAAVIWKFSDVDLALNGIDLPRSPYGEFIGYDWEGRNEGYGWGDDSE